MEFSLDLKHRSKQQENPRLVRKTGLGSQAKHCRNPEDRLKSKHSVFQPSGNLPCDRRPYTNDGISFEPKSSRNSQQFSDKSDKDDELVKYMSNLPGYLQRMERGANVQDMALNVGVLDWARLEKWKSKQKCDTVRDGNRASFSLPSKATNSSTSSNTLHSERLAYKSKERPPVMSDVNNWQPDDIPALAAEHSYQNTRYLENFETAYHSKNRVDGQERLPRTHRSSGKNDAGVVIGKEKRRYLDHSIAPRAGYSSSSSRSDGKSVVKKKGLDQKMTSSIGASSAEVKTHNALCDSKEQKNVSIVEPKKEIQNLQESAIDRSPGHETGDRKNIVLLLPRKYLSNISPEEPRVSVGESLTEADHSSFTDSFSREELRPLDFRHDIPHSCPLPSGNETNLEPRNLAHIVGNNEAGELWSDACCKSPCSHEMPISLPAREYEEKDDKFGTGNIAETSKKKNQEASKVNSSKGRDPSPNRRFNFSLSRMTRSFSLKESSTLPQSSSSCVSPDSVPEISKASSFNDNTNTVKTRGHSRARSSPLRRLLDPLLKAKGLHSDDAAPPLQRSLKSSINTMQSLEKEKHEISRLKALLQLTVRNGLPLLRFVVDNSSILAVPLRNSTSSMKNTAGCNYTFYAIDEIKKKSGRWMNLGDQGKGCGYVYNVVGQMKVRGSSSCDLSGQYPINHYTVKESVLFGVKLKRAEEESPMFMPSGELAAIVVKAASWNLSHSYSGYFSENACSNIVTAILPGAIHGFPSEGVPSSLIHRWKTGGSCDCGGWDVGCKLRVLSNENQPFKDPKTSKYCTISDCYELFDQGGAQSDKPIFSLAPIEKGIYAVEFSSSLSSLQAFFISVTIMHCKESADLVEGSSLSDKKVFPESNDAHAGRIHMMER